MPKPRSGHSLTCVGDRKYIMYGGIEDSPNNKVVPNAEVWQLIVGPSKLHENLNFLAAQARSRKRLLWRGGLTDPL